MHFLIFSMVLLVNSHFIFTEKHSFVVTSVKSTNKQLSLKKRSLLIPKYGSVKLTIGFGKAILGNSPRGLSFSSELSGYYAGPTKLKEWVAQSSPKPSDLFNKTSNKNPFGIKTHKHYNLLSYGSVPSMVYKGKTKKNKYSPMRSVVGSRRRRNNKLAPFLDSEIQCSIWRIVCRNQASLLLPGYSMVQDIVRAILLTPANKVQSEMDSSICDSSAYCKTRF